MQSAENALSVLRHSGNHWSLQITNVWMKCPTGYNLRVTNSSAYGVTNIGLRQELSSTPRVMPQLWFA